MAVPDNITKECKLQAIFEAQAELMEVIEKHSDTTGSVSGNILAMIVECAELANEEGSFKWWKKTGGEVRDDQLDELVDILFFWAQTAIKLGFSPADIFKGYMKKWQVNINRQLNNY